MFLSRLLSQSIKSLNCFCATGESLYEDVPKVLVTPSSLLMTPEGKICLGSQSLHDFLPTDFCPPEWRNRVPNGNDANLEKVYLLLHSFESVCHWTVNT